LSGWAQLFFTLSNSAIRRLDRMSLAPRADIARANASPIPEDAPVIHTTLFLRDLMKMLWANLTRSFWI
jgi:hypothetical protein